MAVQKDEGPQLQIRCPSCGQDFKVGAELRDRTVECGGCEHRFTITDDVIVRVRRVYPGERRDPSLNQFQRVSLAEATERGPLQTVTYGDKPDPAHIDPPSPQRIMAGGAGLLVMALMMVLLVFGAAPGSWLDGIPLESRLVMAGFAAVLGLVLLLYANPKARIKAGLAGVLLGAGLVSLPFLFQGGSVPLQGTANASQPAKVVEPPDPAEANLEELRDRIGTGPLEMETERLKAADSDKKAWGVWLMDLRESNTYLVRDYLIRVTGADLSSSVYPRDRGNFLMVVTGIDHSLEELAVVVSKLGRTEALHQEIGVVEVRVNNRIFEEVPDEKLSNENERAFYDLNKRELDSIDLTRVSRAVERLAEAEPDVYRADITRKLIELMGQDQIDFKVPVARALMTWAAEAGPASEAAMKVVRDLREEGRSVPSELVALIVKEKNLSLLPILDELWLEDPISWESYYSDYGPAAEPVLLARFPETEGITRYSAIKILGKIGGKASLPVLVEARREANPELRVLLDQAEQAIRGRLAS